MIDRLRACAPFAVAVLVVAALALAAADPALAQAAARTKPSWLVSLAAGLGSALVVAVVLGLWAGKDMFWVALVVTWGVATYVIRYEM
jgi:Na+-driven multidrug efflux pump